MSTGMWAYGRGGWCGTSNASQFPAWDGMASLLSREVLPKKEPAFSKKTGSLRFRLRQVRYGCVCSNCMDT